MCVRDSRAGSDCPAKVPVLVTVCGGCCFLSLARPDHQVVGPPAVFCGLCGASLRSALDSLRRRIPGTTRSSLVKPNGRHACPEAVQAWHTLSTPDSRVCGRFRERRFGLPGQAPNLWSTRHFRQHQQARCHRDRQPLRTVTASEAGVFVALQSDQSRQIQFGRGLSVPNRPTRGDRMSSLGLTGERDVTDERKSSHRSTGMLHGRHREVSVCGNEQSRRQGRPPRPIGFARSPRSGGSGRTIARESTACGGTFDAGYSARCVVRRFRRW
jgi:hypothetical protein